MTKVANFGISHTYLDKLAQLSPSQVQNGSFSALTKRAKAKYFTSTYLPHLIDLDSPLRKSYVSTIFCCSQLHQKGDKITSHYCNTRWCIVCNRIRIAKSINGYMPQLQKLDSPQFVTLTVQNVSGTVLKACISQMIKDWRLMYQQFQKRKIKFVGIRKIECTYNIQEDTYHPHFHMIIEGRENADLIVADWLRRNPTASTRAQDIRSADAGSMLELFKYFTKIITNQKLIIPAMDGIFQAMSSRRVFQPFGIKRISEEVDELQAEVIDGIDAVSERFWNWINHDWFDEETSKSLTGYVPSRDTPGLEKLFKNIVV